MRMRRLGAIAALLLASVLAGCGGGASLDVGDSGDDSADDFAFHPPRSSGRAAALTISGAGPDTRMNGLFSSEDVRLSDVLGFFATADDPRTCRFQFSGLGHSMSLVGGISGEVRYLPDTSTVRHVLLVVSNQQFRQAARCAWTALPAASSSTACRSCRHRAPGRASRSVAASRCGRRPSRWAADAVTQVTASGSSPMHSSDRDVPIGVCHFQLPTQES